MAQWEAIIIFEAEALYSSIIVLPLQTFPLLLEQQQVSGMYVSYCQYSC